ncbi:MAG: hypothetical protein F6J94_00360 [Moorea sp. SIO1F2]|uniref:hypothetical protein n=1 Tax=unclassified Moorena TaxID=2683338 RepID=UPI0013B65CE9|nr:MULTISPECIES: hypothetical protein [unclassified Moorena]NEO18944.1 hypothetical protein [Moorena sp. SIO4A5]NEQ56147.1 hypothetical protein [Moorena sp. SIO4A1]NET80497.1 hypothetical protein [Moorena sp. SIO1F2]
MKTLKLLPFVCVILASMQPRALALSKLFDSVEDALKRPFKIVAEGVAEGASDKALKEFEEFFNSSIRPFSDDVINKVDRVAANNILRTEEAAQRLLDHSKDNILAIENQVVEDIDHILERVDERYRGAMRETFLEINRARAETLIDVRYTLGTVDQSLEARINQIALEMMTLLAQVDKIVQKTPGTFYKELFDPTITRLENLERDIFIKLDELVKTLNCSRAGTIEDLRISFNKIIEKARSTLPFSIFRRRTSCEKEMRQVYQEGSDIYFYRVSECEINKIINQRGHTLTVQQIADNYGQLQLNASRMACLAKDIAPDLHDQIKGDWLEYGIKTRFWKNYLTNSSQGE